ncbi:MAG: hypothetical protein AB1671_22200 [Thermodesulfobacteriota bacterium]|jgi:hypothetical protein
MARQHSQRPSTRRHATDGSAQGGKVQKRQTSAGISNRPPAEEEHRQEQLPPRGQAKQ